MAAKYILTAFAAAFLLAGTLRRLTRGPTPQSRIWLFVGIIFAIVSLFLFTRT